MKAIAKTKRATSSFEDEFIGALRDYVARGGEESLGRAYELGRRAMSDGKSLMDIVSIHHRGLVELLAKTENTEKQEELIRAGVHFLVESLSPYEMARRGFEDAVKALRRFNETLEEEIKRIAHAVHDDAGQLLVAVHLALVELADGLPPAKQELMVRIKALLEQTEAQLRRYSHELRPAMLDDLGLVPGIRFLAGAVSQRTRLPIKVKASISKRLPGPLEIAAFRVVQEALNNIVKHARASKVCISLFAEPGFICCEVRDDGAGFDVQAARRDSKQRGLGLIGMQERVNALGGKLSVDSAPKLGTRILVRLPVR